LGIYQIVFKQEIKNWHKHLGSLKGDKYAVKK